MQISTIAVIAEPGISAEGSRNAPVTSGVSRILGRHAKDFSDHARETAATGIWSAQP